MESGLWEVPGNSDQSRPLKAAFLEGFLATAEAGQGTEDVAPGMGPWAPEGGAPAMRGAPAGGVRGRDGV